MTKLAFTYQIKRLKGNPFRSVVRALAFQQCIPGLIPTVGMQDDCGCPVGHGHDGVSPAP